MLHGILNTNSRPTTVKEDDILISFVAPLSIISNQPTYSQDSMNLRRRVSSQRVQRWEITTNLHPMNNSANALIHGIQNGTHTSFLITMPQVHGLPEIESVANTSAPFQMTAYDDTITTTQSLKKGEFINIGPSQKVYAVLADSTSKTVGETIYFETKIMPPLLQNFGTSIVYRGRQTLARVYYDMDTQLGIHYVDGVLSDPGSVKFVEDIV